MPLKKSFLDTADISSRPMRRCAILSIVDAISRIRNAEMAYMGRIPDNLHNSDAYAAAEESIDMLTEAIETLSAAY